MTRIKLIQFYSYNYLKKIKKIDLKWYHCTCILKICYYLCQYIAKFNQTYLNVTRIILKKLTLLFKQSLKQINQLISAIF